MSYYQYLFRVWESPLGRIEADLIPDNLRGSLRPPLSLGRAVLNEIEDVYPYNWYYVDVYANSPEQARHYAQAFFEEIG